jgi:hypothetical protein
MSRFCLVSIVFVAACSDPSSMMMSGDDVGPTPDAPMMQSTLDPADCTAFAQSFATAAQACGGTSLPAGAQAMFEGWCKKGITAGAATMCGGNPGAGLDCFSHADSQDWVCSFGEPYPACQGDLGAALGALCVVALGNPQCSTGVHCNYDVDCSNGLVCNSATNQCMSKSAYCIGLPCKYDVDCPTDEMCNSAEGACVGK